MRAYVFPGQGSQFPGMGADLYSSSAAARALFDEADSVLGFSLSEVMFRGTADDLRQTRITQPAVFLHSVAVAASLGDSFAPAMVAGHSLGEISALVASGALGFADGLRLVARRAAAMQRACEESPSTMAAVLGLSDAQVEEVCASIDGVVPANYNCPGQVVISGSVEAVDLACTRLTELGARRALRLAVSGAFHSPFMDSARADLAEAIAEADFHTPRCPIYQNVTALPSTDPSVLRANLVAQLTAPVRWTQSVERMIADGATEFVEVGPGKVLQGLVAKIDRSVSVSAAL